MTKQTLSVYSLKGEAKALEQAARASNEPITHGEALEAVARRHGYKSWRAAQAVLPRGGPAEGQASARSSQEMAAEEPGAEAQSERAEVVVPGPAVIHGSIDPRLGFAPDSVVVPLKHESRQEIASYYDRLCAMGLSEVTHHDLKGEVFVDVTIEGHRLQAIAGHQPYVLSKKDRNDVPLGVSVIAPATARPGARAKEGWAICKYHNQPHIWLEGMSDAGLRAVAVELGLGFDYTVGAQMTAPKNERLVFYASKAYAALVDWAKKHPRKIGARQANSYLGHWAMAAAKDAGLSMSRSHKEFLQMGKDQRRALIQ